MIECSKFQRMITEYLDENVTPEQLLFFENHFSHCPECAHIFQNVKNLVVSMRSLPVKHVSNSFEERLFDEMSRTSKRSDFKIIRSLGIAAAVFLMTVGGYWAFGPQSGFTTEKASQVKQENRSVQETTTDTVPTFNKNENSLLRMVGQKSASP